MIDHDKYPAGKYREGGRVWPFVDCYGLVLEVRRDLGLPDWPEWADIRAGDGSMVEVAGKWFPTLTPCEPEEGALIALYQGSEMRHVGVVVRCGESLKPWKSPPSKTSFACRYTGSSAASCGWSTTSDRDLPIPNWCQRGRLRAA